MRRASLLALLLLAAGCDLQSRLPQRVDWAVRGGLVYDGTGGAARRADVAIDEGKIVAIGSLRGIRARHTLDATGRSVAPGFVDVHSHADLILLASPAHRDPLLEAKMRQGVTTIVVGNCGLGVAPADDRTASVLAGVNGWMTPDGVAAGALDTAGYLDRVAATAPPLNVATLVPHGPLRIGAMGLAPGRPSAAQLDAMRSALRRSLDEGAFGLSTGLIYPPGMYSDTDELIALARVVAERDGLFTSHVRGSSELLLQATDELIRIVRESGVRGHHSHLEAVGERWWPEVAGVLAREDAARASGLRLSHDVFPYTRAATMMVAIFPPWALEGGLDALLERLREPGTREEVRRGIESYRPTWPPWEPGGWPHNLVGAVGWDGIRVASVSPGSPHAAWVGRTLQSIAEETGRAPFDVVADLMLEERGLVGQLVGEISGESLDAILTHPAAAIISDAEDYGRGAPHPAHAGAFARVLRRNREDALLPESEMIRRMTSYPAEIVGLDSVGRLEVGGVADLVVFDPKLVADRADWDAARAAAEGVDAVMVGGRWVVREGRFTPAASGRVLRSN